MGLLEIVLKIVQKQTITLVIHVCILIWIAVNYSSRAYPKTSYAVYVYNLNIITGKGSENRACAAQKKEEKSAQTSRKGDIRFIFISVYAFTILIYIVPRSIIYAYHSLWHGTSNFGIYLILTVYFEHFKLFSNSLM